MTNPMTTAAQLTDYKVWLTTLGYSESKVSSNPRTVKEFMEWLSHKKSKTLEVVKAQDLNQYKEYLTKRPNKRRPGGLSVSHINGSLTVLRQFSKYLRKTGQQPLPIDLPNLKEQTTTTKRTLTNQEIESLYQATTNDHLGERDKAILALYYGCGLRKSEGYRLDVNDIDFHSNYIQVRKSKNGKSRKVPMTGRVKEDLETYVYQSRSLVIKKGETSLLVSNRGTRLSLEGIVYQFKKLQERTSLKENKTSLHTLRHSIATHLLQKGMKLENISLFLGHKSLDSTQVYTHITHAVL